MLHFCSNPAQAEEGEQVNVVTKSPQAHLQRLYQYIEEPYSAGQQGIIFCSMTTECEEIAALSQGRGIQSSFYHGESSGRVVKRLELLL